MVAFNFPPQGWAFCEGAILPISQNQALFSLLGTTFGGDGRVNFALPDLRGRTPIHVGSGHTLGERGGEQAHTLSIAELPTHAHVAQGVNAAATTPDPTNGFFAQAPAAIGTVYSTAGSPLAALNPASVANVYTAAQNLTTLIPGTVANVGGSQAHLNMQPFLTLSFCIALQGIFPSPN